MPARNIAPRPTPNPSDTSTSRAPFASVDELRSTLNQTQDTTTTNVRKKVTSACEGCQRRRVKCDGNQPCATCTRTKSECSYLPELDGRSIKRKYHEVQRDQDFLKDLLDTIRNTKDEHVAQIVSLIRSDASMQEIKACVAQQLIDIRLAGCNRSPELKRLQSDLSSLSSEAEDWTRPSQRPDFLEIRRLVDIPLYKLSASPWTKVTDDDDLISHLISVWLTWDKGWYDWVDEDLFVRDMKTGSLDSTFCSPFLVNCILAWACTYSDYKEARTANGAVSPLMFKFIDEAKLLLEDGNATDQCLTTVQGLLFLHGSLAISGHDKLGYRFVLQAIGMTRDLMASPMARKSDCDSRKAEDLSMAINRTCWGVFIVTTQTLCALLKPQMMRAPRRARPGLELAGKPVRLWTPYPYEKEPVPSYRDELFGLGCDVAVVEAELSQVLFNTEERPGRQELEEKICMTNQRLQEIIAKQPRQLNPTTGCCPSLFTHQVRIQSVKLRVYLTLREPVVGSLPKMVATARAHCIEVAVELARISKLYMDSWGSSMLPMMFAHPVTMSLSVLLEEAETLAHSRQITDLCVALRAMSRRWPLCMGLLRMVQLEAREKGWKFPTETDKLFEEFEESAWKQREMKRFISLYPLTDTSKHAILTGKEVDMGKFLEAMEKLELEEAVANPNAT